MKKYNLFEQIGIAENAVSRANFSVNDVDKFTRREYQALYATLNKIQYEAERIMAVAVRKSPKARAVLRNGRIKIKE